MTLQRWDPFREIRRVEDRMSRLLRPSWDWQEGGESWIVPLDLVESSDKVTVQASVPGIDPDDLKVTFENGLLTIKGETSGEREEKEGEYLVRERHAGSFYRTLRLPDTVDPDKAESSYDQGVLTISFPKAEAKMAKQIQIKGAGGGARRSLEGGGGAGRKREAA